jgi:hypothetical protein
VKVHVLVEGRSEQIFLERWAPRAFRHHEFVVHPHQGKGSLPRAPDAQPSPRARGLLDLLPATLRAYAASLDPTREAVLVLIDADSDDCRDLKQRVAAVAERAAPELRVVVRIAVEETEAFYLGDLAGLKQAFPSADLKRAREYANDSICGTAEVFDAVVGDGGMNKVYWAERMGSTLTIQPSQNLSPSFRALHAGLNRLVEPQTLADGPVKPFRHVPKSAKERLRRTKGRRARAR